MADKNYRFFQRYSRHIELMGFGEEGQLKLKESNVAIIGCGGLGSPVMLYLAACGVGHLTIIDDDTVDVSNLQRQVIFGEGDIGHLKCLAAAKHLEEFNSDIQITSHATRLTPENANEILKNCHVLVDCSDNFATRYLLNQIALIENKTLISGAVTYYDGQVFLVKKDKPCYRCLFPVQPSISQAPTCVESAVLGPMVGIIGCMMATEIVKELTGIGESLAGHFLAYNSLMSSMDKIAFQKQEDCQDCAHLHQLENA